MTLLPHPVARLFDVPLAIHRPRLNIILSVLGVRIGLVDPTASVGYTPAARTPGPPSGRVVVIPIHGTLVRRILGLEAESGFASYTGIAAQLDAALANSEVVATLLDIDSPSDESGGVFDLANRIRVALQVKPVWAVANNTAFSVAYALASAVARVFVACTGGAGLIGAIAMHIDQSAKDAKDGVCYTVVSAGERKNGLNPREPPSDAVHAVLKAEVDRVYELFVETVARHRGLNADAVCAIGAGLLFESDAVVTGLADVIGSLDGVLTQPTQSFSLLPTQVALASQADLPRNHQTEFSINDRTDPVAPDRPSASPADSPPQPSAASTVAVLSVADAVEITQICTLAGRTDPTAGFPDAQSLSARVCSQLLAAQAEASPEITSRIVPDAARPVINNPLIDVAKQIAAQSTKKEIRDTRSRRTPKPGRSTQARSP